MNNSTSPLWQQLMLDITASTDVETMAKLVNSVFETLCSEGINGVDLRNLDSKNVRAEHLACVLRATFRYKNEIPGWSEAIWVAKAACVREGVDYKDALFGLMK